MRRRATPSTFVAIVTAMSAACGRASPPGDSVAPAASSVPFVPFEAEVSVPDAEPADVAPPSTPKLGARAQLVHIYAEPRAGSMKLGYLRAGAVVERDEKPSALEGCSKGWYGIRPKGFVCVGDHATLDMDDPVVKYATRRPDRNAPLPYAYGVALNALAPFYGRIPTTDEARRLEIDLDTHLKYAPKAYAAAIADAGPEYDASVVAEGAAQPVYLDTPPDFLKNGGTVPNVSGLIRSSKALWAGRPKRKEGFAIVATFMSGPGGTDPTGGPEDRRWDLTTDYLLLPHDRLRMVRPSNFRGMALNDDVTLPVAFVRPKRRTTKMWLGENKSEILVNRAANALTGQQKRIDGVDWYGTKDGGWVKAEDVIKIEAPKSWPAYANKGEKWIDISIARQSLVAYEGQKPVYATLVSTGRDGLGDPDSSYATIRGLYRVGTKHVTATMDSNQTGEEFSLRDVPFVQFFESGYAIHGAYWHDNFGEPRSHGCVNLPEWDAMWLFAWTGPEVPEAWHGAMARPLATGTPIWIHP